MPKKALKIAVIVGYHSFEFQPFQEMFEAMPELHCYIQHLEQFTSSTKEVRESYDVLVFYTMCQNTPVNDGPWYEGTALDALNEIGETNQGVVILHHSILAFQNWPLWEKLTGLNPQKYKDYHLDIPMSFHVTAPGHPIMAGVSDFNMVDEAYEFDYAAETPGVEVLLTSNHSLNMTNIAWTKLYRNSRVFCFQSGHNNTSYSHNSFRRILRNGILWTAHKL